MGVSKQRHVLVVPSYADFTSDYYRVRQLYITFLQDHSASWTTNTVVPVDTAATAATLFASFINHFAFSHALIYRTLVLFVISALINTAANCGALGTLLIVRRQIKLGYAASAAFRSRMSSLLPATEDIHSTARIELNTNIVVGAADSFSEKHFSFTDPGGVSSPLETRQVRHTQPTAPSPIRLPSRSKIRALAAQKAGGMQGERTKNLQRLQRVETDLITTGMAMGALSVCLAAQGLWSITLLPHFSTANPATIEAAVLSAIWIYAVINAVSLSYVQPRVSPLATPCDSSACFIDTIFYVVLHRAQIWNAFVNLSVPEPAGDCRCMGDCPSTGPARVAPARVELDPCLERADQRSISFRVRTCEHGRRRTVTSWVCGRQVACEGTKVRRIIVILHDTGAVAAILQVDKCVYAK